MLRCYLKARTIRESVLKATDYFALDLGTTKFCISALRDNSADSSYTLDTVSVNARGMSKGMVSDLKEVDERIKVLISAAQQHFGVVIDRVTLGVAGSHLRSLIHKSTLNLGHSTITEKTLKKLTDQIREEAYEENREILHVIPLQFRVDNRQNTVSPIGFTGESLFCSALVIDADEFYLRDLVKICNQNSLEVEHLVAEPLASASVTLGDGYRSNGVVLIDIGGGTTDGMIFVDGKPIRSFTVNIAGNLITRDIALGLNLSDIEAERCKMFFGLNECSESIAIKNLNGQEREITSSELQRFLLPRINEFLVYLHKEISPFIKLLGSGIVLTGGGAEIKGLDHYIEAKLKLPSRKKIPQLSASNDNEAPIYERIIATEQELIPKNATVIGLLKYSLDQAFAGGRLMINNHNATFLTKFINWFKELH